MILKEILMRLCEGEFSDLAIGYQVDETPLNHEYGKLVRHIDMGLLELHKRFPLRVREATLQQYSSINSYELHDRYAITNNSSIEPIKYLLDSSHNKFVNSDFLAIDCLIDSSGNRIIKNDRSEATSMYTTGFSTIKVNAPTDDTTFSVQYRASHGNLDASLDPGEVDVLFPYSHLEALLYYIAHRVLVSTHMEESNNYLMKFEQSCLRLTELNLRNEDNTQGDQFTIGGWV